MRSVANMKGNSAGRTSSSSARTRRREKLRTISSSSGSSASSPSRMLMMAKGISTMLMTKTTVKSFTPNQMIASMVQPMPG